MKQKKSLRVQQKRNTFRAYVDASLRDMISYKSNDASAERIERLEQRLTDWGAYGDYEAFDAWMEYQNKHVLPFAGGYLEQPPWIRESFKQFNEVYNYLYFTRNRIAAPLQEQQENSNPFSKYFTLKESSEDA